MLKLLLVLLLLSAIGGGIYIGKTYLDVSPYSSVFLDGVTVDGIDLGGMTWAQGEEAVRNQIKDKLNSWYVRLKTTNGQYRDITTADLGISRDPSQALEAAWAVGHAADASGKLSIFDLQKALQTARANGYSFSSVEYDADTSVIDTILYHAGECRLCRTAGRPHAAVQPRKHHAALHLPGRKSSAEG